MSSIALGRGDVVVGVDTHKDEHVAVALDGLGGRLAQLAIPANPGGYAELLTWSDQLGTVRQALGVGHRAPHTASSWSVPASINPRVGDAAAHESVARVERCWRASCARIAVRLVPAGLVAVTVGGDWPPVRVVAGGQVQIGPPAEGYLDDM